MSKSLPDNQRLTADSVVSRVIRQVAGRCRRLVLLRALLNSLIILLASFLVLATLDWLIQHRIAQLSWLPFVLLLGVLAGACGRWILPAWKFHMSDHETARRIELAHPQLGQRLSVFCDLRTRQSDWTEQQHELFVVMELELERELAGSNVADCLRERTLSRLLTVAGLLTAGLVLFGFGFQATFSIASERTLVPWSFPQWPRQHELYVVDHQDKVALGGEYKVKVASASRRLPRDVFVDVRWTEELEFETLRLAKKQASSELVLPAVQQAFAYRIHGGDYAADRWREVSTVIAPNLLSLQVQIQPPEYTELESYQSAGSFRALVDSHVTFTAEVDRPLRAASVVVRSQDQITHVELLIQQTGQGTLLQSEEPIAVHDNGVFWLELHDLDSVVSRSTVDWDITVVEDLVPKVTMTRPTAGSWITPTGVLPLVFLATDDLQVNQVLLQYCIGKSWSPEDLHELVIDPASFLIADRPPYTSTRLFRQQIPDRLHVSTGIDIATLPEVASGLAVQFRVVAIDRGGNRATSDIVVLTVLSLDQYRGRVDQELQLIAKQLHKLQGLLESESEQTMALIVRLRDREDVGIDRQWREISHDLLLRHRSNVSVLHGSHSSVLGRLEFIGRTLAGEVTLPALLGSYQRFESIASELDQQMLPRVQSRLADLHKDKDSGGSELRTTRIQGSEEVVLLLDKAISKLAAVINEQSSEQRVTEFKSFWVELITEQENLLDRSRTAQVASLSNPLTANPRTDVKQDSQALARLQGELANRTAQHVIRLTGVAGKAQPSPSAFAEALNDSPVIVDMRNAARLLLRDDLVEAIEQQVSVLTQMRALLSIFGGAAVDARQQQLIKRVKLLEALKSVYHTQLAILARLEDAQGRQTEIAELAANQNQLAQRVNELSGMKSPTAIMRLSLQTLYSQMQLAHAGFDQDLTQTRRHLLQVLELLERMIDGAAATGAVEGMADDPPAAPLPTTYSAQDLVLIRSVQQDINREVNRLLSSGDLTAAAQQHLHLLIRRQQELRAILTQFRQQQPRVKTATRTPGKKEAQKENDRR